jgi:mannose-6-phosphate isomerase-like protein (cupin superfamily)
MQVIEGAGRYSPATGGEANHWIEHLASKDLSVGTYSIPAGGLDDQEPHREDEIYVVRAGTATLVTGSGTAQVGPGSVIFVPAGEEHQFTDVRGDLSLLVVFAPPYGSRPDVENPGPVPTSS